MSEPPQERIDEVSRYYRPAEQAGIVRRILFYSAGFLSFLTLFSSSLSQEQQSALKVGFLVVVILHFASSEILRLYLVPRAEEARRRQLLSDAFGTSISHDRTALYYNNEYSPSVERLGADTMENALFSRAITARMLVKKRVSTFGYLLVWLVLFAFRTTDLSVLIWITQVVFSQAILVQWFNMEVLCLRFDRVYDCLHAHFLHGIGGHTTKAVATILDAFVLYESAKAAAGLLLSTKVFEELNPALSEEWARARSDLGMNGGGTPQAS